MVRLIASLPDSNRNSVLGGGGGGCKGEQELAQWRTYLPDLSLPYRLVPSFTTL